MQSAQVSVKGARLKKIDCARKRRRRAPEMNQVQVSQVTHQKGEAMRTQSCQVRRRKRARRKENLSGSRANLGLEHPTATGGWMSHLFRQPTLVLAVFALCAAQGAVDCLRISSIEIPPAIWNGSETTLACNYELAPKDQLYSVKWYKDYVEFYRFQPPAATDQTASGPSQPAPGTTVSTSEQPGEPAAAALGGENLNLNYQISPNSKHEFELEGINLDLSKSNATHVHLRAVSLNTEAIFKCEISADSPTFATVSAERQMKVYVLPKQKLTLTEASAQQATSVQVPLSATGNSHAPNLMQLNFYQLNDLINFTCASSATRPAARLTWLLNDVPLSSLSLSGPPVDVLELSQTQSSPRAQLVETRSNLAMRLQAHHLRQLAGTLARNRNQPGQYQAAGSNGYLPLRLTCLAQMALEFASESSVLISGGGKTGGTSKRSKTRDGAQGDEPLAAPWKHGNAAADLDQDGERDLVTHNPRRRLQLDPTMTQLGDGENTEEGPESPSQRLTVSAYRWPPPVPDRFHGANQQQQQHHALAWSSVAPPIGAESNHRSSGRRTTVQPVQAAAAAATTTGTRHILVWTTRQLRAQSDHIEQLLRRSGANQLEAPQIEARTIDSDEPPEGGSDNSESSSSFEVDPYEATPMMASGGSSSGSSSSSLSNYELNELVNFTCYHQAPNSEHLSVQLKWFLNECELTADFINAFDGNKFHASSSATNLTTPLKGRSNVRATAGAKGPAVAQRSLVIEFTPSLFQLKELSLKCKSIVEQPLIEFEQSQLLHLATSPFIQAQLPPQSPPPPPPPVVTNARPSLYQVKHRQQQQPGDQRQRASVIRMRQSSRSSSAANIRGVPSLSPLAVLSLAIAFSSLLLLPTRRHD